MIPCFFGWVRLNSLDLLAHMSQMRIWLDAKRIEPTGFSYSEPIDCAVARVAFKAEMEPGEFAARFDGTLFQPNF